MKVLNILKISIVVVIVAFLVLFVVYNHQMVTIAYLNIKFENMPLWLVVFISIFAGIFIGWFFMFADEVGVKKDLKRKNKEIEALKSEIAQLRQLTIKEE